MTIRQLIDLLNAKIAEGIPETMTVGLEGCTDQDDCRGAKLWSQYLGRDVPADCEFLLLTREE